MRPASCDGVTPEVQEGPVSAHDIAGAERPARRKKDLFGQVVRPLGRAERGVIHLEDQFHNQISLLIQPVTGMVTVQDGYTNGNVVSSGFSDAMQ